MRVRDIAAGLRFLLLFIRCVWLDILFTSAGNGKSRVDKIRFPVHVSTFFYFFIYSDRINILKNLRHLTIFLSNYKLVKKIYCTYILSYEC